MTTETQGAGEQPVVTTTTTETPTAGDKTQATAETTKTPEAATEGENKDGTETTDEGQQPEPKKKGDGGFQRRINRLTADYRAAEARAEVATARARELEGKLTQPTQSDDKRPRLEDFKSYEEYEAADRKWIADSTRRDTLKTIEETRKDEEAKKAKSEERDRIRKARESFDKEADEVADQYEGFDDFLDDLNAGRSPLRDLGQDSLEYIFEHGQRRPELAFHLHQKPDEVKRIAALRPARQVAELARLEASLPKPSTKATQAPPPPKQVGARGGSDTKDPEKMSIDEMRKATGTRRKVDF